ncbi:uncharacterized protein V1516DRAFT_682610 [Lipomyces oligophaga]|uniref:uncharacterized protein n=1 Tax=Lipomyces oligophaga TaxID=45792 RepID=UPI0034CE36E4
MSQSLYTIPPTTTQSLRKLRFGSARALTPQSRIYKIDPKELCIVEQAPEEIYKSLEELADALPGNSPRYVVLSYPIVTADGRHKSPYVLLYYKPENANQQAKMLYAAAVELFRAQADVNKLIEVADEDEVLDVKDLLNE